MAHFHEHLTHSEPDTALIVHPVLLSEQKNKNYTPSIDDQLEEAEGLARAIFLEVLDCAIYRVSRANPRSLLGKGACEEIAALAEELEPSVIIVNHNLSPVQQRNLEREWQTKVIDRTGLILEIFGERAQTKEGRIQVELAALEYQKSRLVRSWTHLERQRGGAGFMGGPGETQIEIDRRIISDKIAALKKDLDKVRKTRELGRKSRERVPYPIIALVGYTNAGKSTLFNTLTGAGVFAEDLPFATLDPTMRKIELAGGQEAILADTVGFIADLPHDLVAAFRATLEQVRYADIILHVRDMARPDHDGQREEVITILEELGIEYDSDPRIIEVMNKIDALSEEERARLETKARFDDQQIALSARTGQGIEPLKERLKDHLARTRTDVRYQIPYADGKALAWLHSHAHVTAQEEGDERCTLITVEIDPANRGRFKDQFGYEEVKPKSRHCEEGIA